MSSLQHAPQSGASSPHRVYPRPSVREVCLVGALTTHDEPASVDPHTRLVLAGRIYRAFQASTPHPSDLRRYWHLTLDPHAVEVS